MRKVIQPALMRGKIADSAAILLFLALLTILCLAVVHGVQALPS
jgi:hypothetical protein